MRGRFDEQLHQLNKELLTMGGLCEEAIAIAAKALPHGDHVMAKKVAPIEEEINRKERDIEALCLKLLLQQQPVARDLRFISAALKMITDMERIGDQAADIAEIIGVLQGHSAADCGYIDEMAAATMKMVTESVDAFVQGDLKLAAAVVANDDTVDNLFDQTKDSLIEMIAAEPKSGGFALDLLMIAKYFERIGDHAVNLAGWVAFSVTGEHKGA